MSRRTAVTRVIDDQAQGSVCGLTPPAVGRGWCSGILRRRTAYCRRLAAVLAGGLLVAACVNDVSGISTVVTSSEVPAGSGSPTTGPATLPITNSAPDSLPPADASPPLRVVLEQVVGGSLLPADRPVSSAVGASADTGHMNAVVAGPAGLLAVGELHASDGESRDAGVWVSTDSRLWTRVDQPDVFGDSMSRFGEGSDQYMSDVAVAVSGVVAVGADGVLFDHDAAIWTSVDGVVWDRVADDEQLFGGAGEQIMHAVAQLGDTTIVVGESSGQAAVWLSTDGDQWIRPDTGEAPGGFGTDPSVMNDVVAFDGGVVAVGSAGVDLCPAVWLSADGLTWSRISAEMAGERSGFDASECAMSPMANVVGATRGVVATGTRGLPDEDPTYVDLTTGGPLVWTSVDGYEWVLQDTTFVPATDIESRYGYLKNGAPIMLEHVVSDGTRLYAGGSYELMLSANDLPNFATLWYSEDGGVTWQM
ncbi:MAG: hypothetical protein QNL12_01680, partial [Acidimicrobiia bacterium]|nr:hypothetical protein [Acidimicrobiia bacterium]